MLPPGGSLCGACKLHNGREWPLREREQRRAAEFGAGHRVAEPCSSGRGEPGLLRGSNKLCCQTQKCMLANKAKPSLLHCWLLHAASCFALRRSRSTLRQLTSPDAARQPHSSLCPARAAMNLRPGRLAQAWLPPRRRGAIPAVDTACGAGCQPVKCLAPAAATAAAATASVEGRWIYRQPPDPSESRNLHRQCSRWRCKLAVGLTG